MLQDISLYLLVMNGASMADDRDVLADPHGSLSLAINDCGVLLESGGCLRGVLPAVLPIHSGHYAHMISLNACTVACANAGLLMCASTSISARLGADRQPDRIAENNAASASGA
jgi:hypothetical protein